MKEAEREEFDPYCYWQDIDLSKLPSQTSTYWKLRVDFDTNNREFDRYLMDITREVKEKERENAM
jgi:hypothetical protein